MGIDDLAFPILCVPKIGFGWTRGRDSVTCHLMIEFLRLILHIMASFFKPRTKLVAEILVLRHQLKLLRRQVSKRPQLSNTDRFLFVWLYRWFPSVLSAIAILRPETIIRWHRAGFQSSGDIATMQRASGVMTT